MVVGPTTKFWCYSVLWGRIYSGLAVYFSSIGWTTSGINVNGAEYGTCLFKEISIGDTPSRRNFSFLVLTKSSQITNIDSASKKKLFLLFLVANPNK